MREGDNDEDGVEGREGERVREGEECEERHKTWLTVV